jgi:RNA polymerase primary sigma factor
MSNQQHLDNNVEEGVPPHIDRLTRTPLLTAEEEIYLTRAIRNGDQNARARLIEANMRLVINIAKNYKVKLIPMEDLIQEGAIGLMQATERFDPDKGFRFSTYATHWIRQAIGRAVDNKSKTIRLPAHVSQTVRRLEKERAIFAQVHQREPTHAELAEIVGCTECKVKAVINTSHDLVSLDVPVGDRFGSTLGSLLPDADPTTPESEAIQGAVTGELQKAVSELSDREQQVIGMKYAPNGQEMGIEQIAERLCVTRERVRHLEISAIRKLQQIARQRCMADII